jgi:hypothetical protein
VGVRASPGFHPHITNLSSVRCSTSCSMFRFLFCLGSLIDWQICESVKPCQIIGVLAGGKPQFGAPGGRCAPTRLWSWVTGTAVCVGRMRGDRFSLCKVLTGAFAGYFSAVEIVIGRTIFGNYCAAASLLGCSESATVLALRTAKYGRMLPFTSAHFDGQYSVYRKRRGEGRGKGIRCEMAPVRARRENKRERTCTR